MFRQSTLSRLAVAFLPLLAAVSAASAAPKAVEAGRAMAERDCSQCHIVTSGGGAGWTQAPSFQSVADRQGESAAAISAYLQKAHLHMLHDNRPKPEADALAAYIMSLRAP